MVIEETMTINERCTYLKRMLPRYRAANRLTCSALLTEMEEVTGMHRKSLTRLLHAPTLVRTPRRTQRDRRYGIAVRQIVQVVWESLDYVCAERLTPQLLATAQHLATFGEGTLTAALEAELAAISRATVGRMLTRLPRATPRLPRRGPEQANRLRRAVPMGRIPWQTTKPGRFEVRVPSGWHRPSLRRLDRRGLPAHVAVD